MTTQRNTLGRTVKAVVVADGFYSNAHALAGLSRDDMGAVLVIAIVYTESLHVTVLLLGVAGIVLVVANQAGAAGAVAFNLFNNSCRLSVSF